MSRDLTVAEAAAYVKVSQRFIRRELNARRLHGVRINARGEWRTTTSACDAWVVEQDQRVRPFVIYRNIRRGESCASVH